MRAYYSLHSFSQDRSKSCCLTFTNFTPPLEESERADRSGLNRDSDDRRPKTVVGAYTNLARLYLTGQIYGRFGGWLIPENRGEWDVERYRPEAPSLDAGDEVEYASARSAGLTSDRPADNAVERLGEEPVSLDPADEAEYARVTRTHVAENHLSEIGELSFLREHLSSMALDPNDKYGQAVLTAAEGYPRAGTEIYEYGTAGFRMKADKLDSVMFQMGSLAGLRSRKLHGQTIGVMITASHNNFEDNGVKLVDPQGDMLEQEWEKYAKYMASAMNAQEAANAYNTMLKDLKIDQKKEAHVIFARDTRPSGNQLAKALTAALEATDTKYTDYGILTTPQLHYLVKATNTQNTSHPYGEVSEAGYYEKLASAFKTIMDKTRVDTSGTLSVDCANGVGAPKLKKLIKHLPKEGEKGHVKIRVVNDNIDRAEVLNEKCGADFVKTQQRTPEGFDGKPWDRWCSYDGDADRIVYYFNGDGPIFRLLDGDRIATLAADFIGLLIKKAGLSDKLSIAVIQTAYANGASTTYIERDLKLKVEFTPTGVKHLHHAAARYDIGVYFEANGHGTILFSPQAMKRIYNHEPESPAQLDNLLILRALTDLINQTVGDALSDMLLVECILAHKEWTVKEWLATYTDKPNQIMKLKVGNIKEFEVESGTAERRLKEPKNVQENIDGIVAKYNDGRAFVRPSGTEPVVRIYCEAASTFETKQLAKELWDFLDGRFSPSGRS